MSRASAPRGPGLGVCRGGRSQSWAAGAERGPAREDGGLRNLERAFRQRERHEGRHGGLTQNCSPRAVQVELLEVSGLGGGEGAGKQAWDNREG